MRLIVWNSRGAKWGIFWQHYLQPALGDDEGVIGLLVEAGWAPWVGDGQVRINKSYQLDRSMAWYAKTIADPGDAAMVAAVNGARRNKAFWIPWVGNVKALNTNSRCSIGGVLAPAKWQVQSVSVIAEKRLRRPVVRLQLGPGRNTAFTILLIHAVSGAPSHAQREMDYLTSSMKNLIPQNTSGIVVGDINIDLGTKPSPPKGWGLLSTPGPTQSRGGNLDYGLLWDPTRMWSQAAASVLEVYGGPNNQSDHSVIDYTLTLRLT